MVAEDAPGGGKTVKWKAPGYYLVTGSDGISYYFDAVNDDITYDKAWNGMKLLTSYWQNTH